jgi:hypothetical protein
LGESVSAALMAATQADGKTPPLVYNDDGWIAGFVF